MNRVLLLAALLCVSLPAYAGARLDAIKARGVLQCGVAGTEAGMGKREAGGDFSGLEADICRAISAAIFGKVSVTFAARDTVPEFLASDSDIALRRLTVTYTREAGADLRFGPIYLYDGQTFLVKADSAATTVDALAGKRICTSLDAAFVQNLKTYFGEHALRLDILTLPTRFEAADMFFSGACEAWSADATELATILNTKGESAITYRILEQRISNEPLAPLLRKGDEAFADIVTWTIHALVSAEALGLTASTIDTKSSDPKFRSFFSSAPNAPGVAPLWQTSVIKAAGNYGEIYARNLGQDSPARLARGPSELWTNGGVLFAPPFH